MKILFSVVSIYTKNYRLLWTQRIRINYVVKGVYFAMGGVSFMTQDG